MRTCRQMAAEWGISTRAVNELCKRGRIPGAVKVGTVWQIPDQVERPKDGRVSSGKYSRKNSVQKRKALPVGISDYVRAQSEYYYVDKTLLIKEFLDRKPLVSLFTRPRRFGKSLNMDMLRVFFERSEEDTGKYFTDKAIWTCGEEYRKHQGKYPVIFLTFKDVKFDSWQASLEKISGLLQAEFSRHREILDSSKLSEYEKRYFEKVLRGEASDVELTSAVGMLSQMLTESYDRAPVVIIDEYDTPVQEGYAKNFYEEIIGFMRNLFSGAFKDNKYITYGFLTGILRITQESIFSGLNNLSVSTIMDDEYASFFGFTAAEVHTMLKYYGMEEKEKELKAWYDGYLFGHTEIYNPWSVINYIAKGGVPQTYWANAGKNEILESVLSVSNDETTENLDALLQGKAVITRIDQNVVFKALTEDPANIYGLLLVSGYLKTTGSEAQGDGVFLCEVCIPNKEIAAVYKNEILAHFLRIGAISRTTANRIAESLYANDVSRLQSAVSEYIDKSVSFFDAGSEGFYHGLTLGLVSLLDNNYRIKSNRESGDGRYDISLVPRSKNNPGILMELKWKSGLEEKELDRLSTEALTQMDEKRYDSEMTECGIENIIKLGVAFSGKKVIIKAG